jgi:TatD DNase family protein
MLNSLQDKDIGLVDTHAHLDFSQFEDDLELVLGRAGDEGVGRIITVGFDLESSRQAVSLAHKYASLKACVGVHPHEAGKVIASYLTDLKELSADDQVVAIGEIGLDYYRDRAPRPAQRRVFREQLDLAAEVGKPVVVHDRDAHGEVMRMLGQWSENLAASNGKLSRPLGVVHCYSGDQAMAEELFRLGFLISVAGPVTYENARLLQELVGRLPLDRLMVETDCPFLSPHPYRGQRNEPARVRLVASKISEIKGVPLEAVARATTDNAARVFRLDQSWAGHRGARHVPHLS